MRRSWTLARCCVPEPRLPGPYEDPSFAYFKPGRRYLELTLTHGGTEVTIELTPEQEVQVEAMMAVLR